MLAVAIFVSGFFIAREANRRFQIKQDEIYDLIFWSILAGVIGCRLFFILLNLQFFIDNPSEIIMIQHGGLAWQGGLILSLVIFYFYTRWKKWPWVKLADLIAPYVALGQSIGRWGCFLNGCCYGKEVSWGIYSPERGVHEHPTQIYLSIGAFLVFIILKKISRHQKFDGQIFVLYFMLEAVARFIIEFFRADHDEIIYGLSIFQLVCIGLFIGSVYVYTHLQSRRRV